MLAERQFYIKDAEVAYYMAMNKRDLFMPDSTLKPFPVYELFFDSPVAVKDTFYIGFNFETNCRYHDPTLGRVFNYKYTMTLNGLLPAWVAGRRDTVTIAQRRTEESPNYDQGTWLIRTRIAPQTIVFLYAITEPDDGTGGGSGSDTTLTITASDAAARYVSVQPNPAVDEARVLSRGHPRRQGLAPRHLPPPHHHPLGHGDEEAAGGVRLPRGTETGRGHPQGWPLPAVLGRRKGEGEKKA